MGLSSNAIPENVRRIHLTAACGTGMGALACMLSDLGYFVTGSDRDVYPPMSDFLREKGIGLTAGFAAENIEGADLVVIGNAVSRDNPEAMAVMETGAAYCSMPQALNHFVGKGKKIVLVCGTHGKTTTAALMAWVLFHQGFDPSFFIGGILKDFNSNYRIGQGDWLVIEGDEYDTAFFDKGPKFLHYRPEICIVTGVEFDHADIYRDLDHVRSAFSALLERIPIKSTVIACQENPVLMELLGGRPLKVQTYGGTSGDWQSQDAEVADGWCVYTVTSPGGGRQQIKTRLMGRHNQMNALAVTGAAAAAGIPETSLAKALTAFSGIRRRQEVRGVVRGITVMDDFAHHPTAVRETLAAVKPFYTDGNVVAVFEPRTNSSMRRVFQNDYPPAFDLADMVVIRRPSMFHKVPVNERLSCEQLVDDIKFRGVPAFLFDSTDDIINFLVKGADNGDLLLIMSNGGFDGIHTRLLKRLSV